MRPGTFVAPALMLTVLAPLGPGASAHGPTVTCHGTPATIIGTNSNDVLEGTPGRDVISGLRGNDLVTGLGGNDLLCGGRGADHLFGGPGNDELRGGLDRVVLTPDTLRTGDGLVGGPGNDFLSAGWDPRGEGLPGNTDAFFWTDSDGPVRVNVAAGRARGEGRDVVRIRGAGAFHLSDYDDTFVGTDAVDVVHAYDGDDDVTTRGAPDLVHLDTDESLGNDVVRTGTGDDEIRSLGGADQASAGPGRDVIVFSGSSSTQSIHAGLGKDTVETLLTESTGQVLVGGPADDNGTDRLLLTVLADGDDHRYDLGTGEMLLGTAGTQVLVTGFEEHALLDGRWTLNGSAGADDVMVSGASTFTGRGGPDSFVGSPEDDTFAGGLGQDTYSFDPGGTNTCRSVEHDPEDACTP